MKTSEAIQALRPLSNWGKSITRLEEVLNHIQEREKVIEGYETQVEGLKNQIQKAEEEWAKDKKNHEDAKNELIQQFVTKRDELISTYERQRETLDLDYRREESKKEALKQEINRLKDDEVVLINSIRDKKAELDNLADQFKNVLLNASKFVGSAKEI